MDQSLRLMYNVQDPRVRRREDRARGGVPALEVLVEKLANSAGFSLPDEERQSAGIMAQWVMGIGAGVVYAALRRRLPGKGIWRGIGYGAAFSLVVDEGLVRLLGLAPAPTAFPWQTHVRGFTGHLVFGAVAETAMEWLNS